MPTGDIVKLTVVGEIHGQMTNNVLHFRFTSDVSTFAGLFADIIACIRTALLPGLSNEWKLVELRGKKLWPNATDDVIFPAATTDIGGTAAEGLPSYCAALISIKTGQAGRRHRGRFYVAGVPESGQVGSRLTAPELAVLVAYAQCLVDKFISQTSIHPYFLGILSRKKIAEGTAINQAFTQGSVLQATNVMMTQRRRRLGIGS